MQSLDYLAQHYLTKEQMLRLCHLSEKALTALQQAGAMPAPSYRAEVHATIHSVFGAHEARTSIDYFPKSAVNWIGLLQTGMTAEEAFALFSGRYTARIQVLAEMGLKPSCRELKEGLADHLQVEWRHFLAGTYGLCTKTGLPEDIATKEVAIFAIDEWTQKQQKPSLNEEERKLVTLAVNLLDEASADFAPHERPRSSRARCIDGVRAQYGL